MTALTWQTLLLLGLAYFAGCACACFLRRMMRSGETKAAGPRLERIPDPVPVTPTAVAPAAAGSQAAGPVLVQASAASPSATAAPARDAFRRTDTDEPVAPRADGAPAASVPQPTAAKAAAPPPAAAASPADDLKRIRLIDQALETALNKLGVRRYAEIAAWKPADVAQISSALGFKGRIEEENWIEQAQILARGEETHYARRLARGEQPSAIPIVDEGETGKPIVQAPIASVSPAPAAPSPRVAQPAAAAPVARPASPAPAAPANPSAARSSVEAAAATAAALAAAAAAKAVAASVTATPAAPAVPAAAATPATPPLVSERAAFANRPVSAPVAAAPTPPAPPAQPPAAVVPAAPPASPAAVTPAPRPVQPTAAPARPPTSGVGGMSAASAAAAAAAASAVASAARPARPVAPVPPAAPAAPPAGAQPARPAIPLQAAPAAAPPAPRTAAPAPPAVTPAAPSSPAVSPPQPKPPSATPPAAAATPTAPPAGAAARPSAANMRDSLQRISGINPEIEKLLNVQGITRFSQIAQWGKPEIERFDRLLGHPGRVPRENWVEQAQILAKGGDTAYSREFDRRHGVTRDAVAAAAATTASPSDNAARTPPKLVDAIRENQSRTVDEQPQRTTDLSSLRSVRAPAFRAAEQSQPPAREGTGVRAVRSAVPDDLKRIRGIGVLIEKKLNSMGVTSYEQVANWSVADIERVSHLLDFKGRIERENWVEQARILASGGQTEFSRRTDGGETV